MTDPTSGLALPDLLDLARDAAPTTRIEFRDDIADYGEAAIDAMADWLDDDRLAAFATRVLERIGQDPAHRLAVVSELQALDRSELPAGIERDLEWALSALGAGAPRAARASAVRSIAAVEPVPSPGVPGRGYWVMRTSPWERPYIWSEAGQGRLRQGWGALPEQDLDVIAEVVRRGGNLSDAQRVAIRSRRMNTSAPDGMRLGDIVVTPNLPTWGSLSVFRVSGSYAFSLGPPLRFGERFGHILPVEFLVAGIDRRSPRVSDTLRAMLRPQSRLYGITAYGGEVERLVEAPGAGLESL